MSLYGPHGSRTFWVQILPGAGVYDCSLEKKREQLLYYVCISLMVQWAIANRGCLARELPVSLSKIWHVLWSVLHVLRNDPPSSTQMDGPCVKSVECTFCSMTVLVRYFLRQSFVPSCSILPKYENESENHSLRSLLTFHVFAQLSHLVAMRQAMNFYYLTSSCTYGIFSLLKWT
jgi:hypothetical protein